MSDDLATWLRGEIKARMQCAQMISQGGFAPQRWDTEPAGQVNPASEPASGTISDAIRQEREYSSGWVQIAVYERLNNEPPAAEYREPGVVAALAEAGRRQFEHIIRHDPRDTIARCEAELAILDDHSRQANGACRTCITQRNDYPEEWVSVAYPCPVARLLCSAYRHQSGYREEWKP